MHTTHTHRHDMLARQVAFVELAPAVRTDAAVARKQLAVCEARQQLMRVDIGHALGANDGVDVND